MLDEKAWTKDEHLRLIEALGYFTGRHCWAYIMDHVGTDKKYGAIRGYCNRLKAHVGDRYYEYITGGEKPTAIEAFEIGRNPNQVYSYASYLQ